MPRGKIAQWKRYLHGIANELQRYEGDELDETHFWIQEKELARMLDGIGKAERNKLVMKTPELADLCDELKGRLRSALLDYKLLTL